MHGAGSIAVGSCGRGSASAAGGGGGGGGEGAAGAWIGAPPTGELGSGLRTAKLASAGARVRSSDGGSKEDSSMMVPAGRRRGCN